METQMLTNISKPHRPNPVAKVPVGLPREETAAMNLLKLVGQRDRNLAPTAPDLFLNVVCNIILSFNLI